MNPILEPFRFSTEIQLRWKDIDQFGHVNNAVYLTYFETARFYYNREVNHWNWDTDQYIIASMQIDYLRPLHYPGDIRVYLRIDEIGQKSFGFQYAITFFKNNLEKVAVVGKSKQVMYDVAQQRSILIPEHIRNEWIAYEKTSHIDI